MITCTEEVPEPVYKARMLAAERRELETHQQLEEVTAERDALRAEVGQLRAVRSEGLEELRAELDAIRADVMRRGGFLSIDADRERLGFWERSAEGGRMEDAVREALEVCWHSARALDGKHNCIEDGVRVYREHLASYGPARGRDA